ncbi:MAG: hypothetical protein N2Z69_03755 [Methylophilaceae bacterium]|nr:hypothetical protein [Methylophilaceae bacterium]
MNQSASATIETLLTPIEQALQQLQTLGVTSTAGLQQLVALDTATKAYAQALADFYVDTRRFTTEEESRMWTAGHDLHEQLSTKYTLGLHDLADGIIPTAEAPALVARLLFQRGRAALWDYFRYLPTPPIWWLETHKLYAFAERERFADHPVILYADEAPSTCAALYLQILLLGTLNRTNMSKRQIENVYHWLLPWASQITLDRQFNENIHLYYVNLEEDRSGRRIRNLDPTPACRYWSTEPMAREIARALDHIEQGAPQFTGLEPKLLRDLYSEWSRNDYKRQRRRDERIEIQEYACVAHGIYAVCQEVQAQSADNVLMDQNSELWKIENESGYGLGATLNATLNTWLKIGRLIALRKEHNKDICTIGVVRSIKQQDAGKVRVGIEILSHVTSYATLQELHDGVPTEHRFPGVFLPSDESRRLASSLLIPALEYHSGVELRLRLGRTAYRVRPRQTLEHQDDWVWTEIEVLGKVA